MPFQKNELAQTQTNEKQGLNRRLAAARTTQLQLARLGRVLESAKYAERAKSLRASLRTRTPKRVLAAAAMLMIAPLASAQPALVRTAEVTEDVAQEHRRVTGSLQAISRSSLASQEPGLVRSVLVDEGYVVRRGEVVAQLDPRRLQAQLEEARAEHANYAAVVAQREAELDFARLDLERLAEALKKSAASEREMSEAKTLVGVRIAQLEAARKVVESITRQTELLEIRLDDMTIRAPFDARVVSRHVEPGEWIEPGDPLVTLISVGMIEARLEVPERFANNLFGDTSSLYVELAADGRSVPSIDVQSVPDIDPRVRTFQVIVRLDNSDGSLAPGMSVSAWVPTSEEGIALLVPKDAVIRHGSSAHVFRIDQEKQAEQTGVTVLFEAGEYLALGANAHLKPGDRVIIEGNERLQPGTTVASVPEYLLTPGSNH